LAAPEAGQIHEVVCVDPDPATDGHEHGLEDVRGRDRRLRGHKRQVVIGLLSPDDRGGPEAVTVPNGERQEQERPVSGVLNQDDARLEVFVSREGVDIGPRPFKALVGRADALDLHGPPYRFDVGEVAEDLVCEA